MQRAVGRDRVDRVAAHRQLCAAARAQLEGGELLSRRRVEQGDTTLVVGREHPRRRWHGSRPVVAHARVIVRPHDAAVRKAHAGNVTAAGVATVWCCCREVRLAVAHGDGREGLLGNGLAARAGRGRQRSRDPDCGQRVRRERLDASAVQRHQDEAIGVLQACGRVHTRGKARLVENRPGRGVTAINLRQRGVKNVTVHDDRVARVDEHVRRAARLCPSELGIRAGAGHRRREPAHHARLARALVAGPSSLEARGTRGVRLDDQDFALGRKLLVRAIVPDDLAAVGDVHAAGT